MLWLTGRPERTRRADHDLAGRAGPADRAADHAPQPGLPPGPDHQARELRKLRTDREIAVVVDDDPQVIELLAADGFPTRLADWQPRTAPLHDAQESDGRT